MFLNFGTNIIFFHKNLKTIHNQTKNAIKLMIAFFLFHLNFKN